MPFKVAAARALLDTHQAVEHEESEKERRDRTVEKENERERRFSLALSTRVSFSMMYPEETESRAYLYYR